MKFIVLFAGLNVLWGLWNLYGTTANYRQYQRWSQEHREALDRIDSMLDAAERHCIEAERLARRRTGNTSNT